MAFNWDTPLVSGLVVTAGGVAFTGAVDAYLRAFRLDFEAPVAQPAKGAAGQKRMMTTCPPRQKMSGAACS
jgi:hypothetical protein